MCLRRDDQRHDYEYANIPLSEANYGIFRGGKELLENLSKSTLVVSSHIHFKSAYTFGEDQLTTGTKVWDEIEKLNSGESQPRWYWQKNPRLLITLPPIGPRPARDGDASGFVLLRLEEDGITNISFQNLEE